MKASVAALFLFLFGVACFAQPADHAVQTAPGYTDEARTSNTQGRIRIDILFRKDGRLQHMFLLRTLGKGLDAQALTAARKIAFEPMKIDGKPASIVKAIEYSFSIY